MPYTVVSFTLSERIHPLLLTLMNLMVSWHVKVHSHLLCWQSAHIGGGMPRSDRLGHGENQREVLKVGPVTQSMMPYLQEDPLEGSRAIWRTQDLLVYKVAYLLTIIGLISSTLAFILYPFS